MGPALSGHARTPARDGRTSFCPRCDRPIGFLKRKVEWDARGAAVYNRNDVHHLRVSHDTTDRRTALIYYSGSACERVGGRRRQRQTAGRALVRDLPHREPHSAARHDAYAAVFGSGEKGAHGCAGAGAVPVAAASENAGHGAVAHRGGGPRGLYRQPEVARFTSGGTASAASAVSAASRLKTSCFSWPSLRTETVRSAASFLPTTSKAGTLASECSRTL